MSRNFWQTSGVVARRACFLVMMLACGIAGCADSPENKAVKSVDALGGRVGHGEDQQSKNAVEANLSGTRATDEQVKDLAPLKDLRRIDLSSTNVTDAALKQLAGFKSLEYLDLTSTAVTDAGMKDLAALDNLKTLILSHTKVTNAGIRQLSVLKNLRRLDLFGTPVTDAGVGELRRAMPGCKIEPMRN